MINLSGRSLPVKPTSVHPFFDKVQVWVTKPIDGAIRQKLRKECGRGGIHIETRPARFNPLYRHRIELRQPSDQALCWVANRPDALLNRIEITLDFIFKNGAERDDGFDFLSQHLVRGWHGRKQRIKTLSNDRQGRPRLGGQTRYDASRSAPNSICFYKEKFSRSTGELNCLHFEWRASGVKALRSAGISSGSDLLSFDHRKFWLPRLKLCEVEPTKLGRLLRKNGWRSRPLIENRFKLERFLGQIVINGSATVQELLDGYRAYPVRRVLRPLSTKAWLPEVGILPEDEENVGESGGYKGNGRSVVRLGILQIER